MEARWRHRWGRGAVVRLLEDALTRRVERLPADTTCYRWISGELPGVAVDRFGPVAVLSLYTEGLDEQSIATALVATPGIEAVYVKRRPREARKLANEAGHFLAPPLPLVGSPVDSLVVTELGARFEIRPGNGLSVGLYLDARDARAWVRANASGRRVLNTFSYTCGFGVVARLGGAARAVNIDASRKVLDWGERNCALNGLEVAARDFVSGDTFDWLGRFAKKAEKFDLVILDPPGFATTKHSRFTAERDYHRLVAAAREVLAPGGLLLAMCNVEQSTSAFVEQLRRGMAARSFKEVARFGPSEIDFPQPTGLRCHVLETGLP